jgi:hypothetical protein
MSETSDYNLKLIGPEQFKDEFAEGVGIAAVRSLFKSEGFPSVKIGERYYTTRQAARHYLETLSFDKSE